MELVEVECVDALLGAHQDVLVVRLGVDPRCRAVDPQWTPVENLQGNVRWDFISDSDT